MKALTKKRLLRIADEIEAAPADRFNMGSWIQRKVKTAWGRQVSYDESVDAAKKLLTSCGTAGCVAGWTVGVFPRAGNPNHFQWSYSIEDHATRILDLSPEEAWALFHTGMQMNNRKAAERIRKAVETGVIERVGPRGGKYKEPVD